MMARHPKTQFVALHFGNFSEDLQNVAENLDRYPNMSVDMAARIGELGGSRSPPGDFSTNTRTGFCSRPMPLRTATNFLSKFSTTNCTRSTTGSRNRG